MVEHTRCGTTLTCPLCKVVKNFSVVSKFRVHTARYHPVDNGNFALVSKDAPIGEVAKYHGRGEFLVSPHVSDLGNDDDSEIESDRGSVGDFLMDNVSDENIYPEYLIKDQLARYYLKLESDFILPSTQVQDISREIRLISEFTHHSLKKALLQQLQDAGVDENSINSIVQGTFKQDPIFNIHHKNEDVQQLSTNHLREKFWKENYAYVEPKQIKVGTDANGKSRYAHFVSIREALTVLLRSDRVKECVRKSFDEKQPSNVLKDFTDGSAYVEHMKQHPNGKCLQLLLFQDGFDFNAFGPTQGLYKVKMAFITLLAICRQSIDQKWI